MYLSDRKVVKPFWLTCYFFMVFAKMMTETDFHAHLWTAMLTTISMDAK